MLEKLIEISNLELVDSKAIIYEELPYKFQELDENFVHEDSLLIGKDTNQFIINMGIMFLILQIILLSILIFYISRAMITKWPLCKRVNNFVRKDLFWNSSLRLVIQACLDISIGFAI